MKSVKEQIGFTGALLNIVGALEAQMIMSSDNWNQVWFHVRSQIEEKLREAG